jgi:hypothetical protein
MRIEHKFLVIFLLAFTLAPLAAAPAWSQDTHYWNGQYGPRSMLLNGAVIGSVDDMSATYYNPGALGYIAQPELLLSANVYQASSLTMVNGAGEGVDLETSDFNPLPNMLAGAFRWKWLGDNRLAYSFLTRYRFNAEVRGGRTDRVDVLPGSPGEEDFAGGLLASETVNELWAGLTWARGARSKVGWGITQYLSIRGQESDFQLFAQARTDSGEMALIYDNDNYSADVYSFLWKAGLGFNFWPVTAGLTLTTPNVQIYSSGQAGINETIIGVDADGDGQPDETFHTDIQRDVTANYRSPLSIGAGAAYHSKRFVIHTAAEWFDAVDAYDVLELDGFISQGTGETIERTVRHQSASVLNYAVGLQLIGNKYSGYLSFNTDFSSFDSESDVAVTGFDIYHATAGTTVKRGRTDFTLGLSYSWGKEKRDQVIDLNPGNDDSVVDPEDQIDVLYRSFTFILGFTVSL